jgi:hypothetical protein
MLLPLNTNRHFQMPRAESDNSGRQYRDIVPLIKKSAPALAENVKEMFAIPVLARV